MYLAAPGQLFPEENCPPFRVGVWFRVSVKIEVLEQFSSEAIVLKSYLTHVICI